MIRFDDRVVIVTGAGAGLGRAHAMAFANRGAKVVVNDIARRITDAESAETAAERVVAEIKANGGQAIANYDSVERGNHIVEQAMDTWGRVDIVTNNAGILRDSALANMTDDDWEAINRVHLFGAYKVTRAAWPYMQAAGYGRIVNTCSAALYGNFGQANYSTAKAGLWGFTRTLSIEGARYGILANAIAPLADSQLMRTIMPAEKAEMLKPEWVSVLVLKLCSDAHEGTGELFEAGGGWFAQVRMQRSAGITLVGDEIDPDVLAASWEEVCDFGNPGYPANGLESIDRVLE